MPVSGSKTKSNPEDMKPFVKDFLPALTKVLFDRIGSDADDDESRDRHWGDQWHYPLARIAVTCRAHGLRPIDGPYGGFTDPEGYVAAARRSAVLGYEGKWAIHPSQVPLANEVFTPDPRLVERTRRIIAAMREAATEGKGAVSLDGLLRHADAVMSEVKRSGGNAIHHEPYEHPLVTSL